MDKADVIIVGGGLAGLVAATELGDRRVLNRIYWRLRTGSPWADIPERFGPSTTCYNRFVRWARFGVWDLIFDAVSAVYEGTEQSVDSSLFRVHQHGAKAKKGGPTPPVWLIFEASVWGAREAV